MERALSGCRYLTGTSEDERVVECESNKEKDEKRHKTIY